MAGASKLAVSKFPKFEFSAEYDYGGYERKDNPGNRHFIPRFAKLKVFIIRALLSGPKIKKKFRL